uniref:2-hydroxyacyl-CoA dehydratase n=1 Tax=candidate division WOR-3 bacterium TaxID=2052148 RepID=A0A7V0Z5E1_UNCW3
MSALNNYEKMWQELGLDVGLHNEVLAYINKGFQNTVGKQKNRPKAMEYFDNVLHESHSGRVAELLEEKSKGKKIVGFFCIYVPEEIIMALDLVPIALCGGTNFSVPYAEKTLPRDICPLVKSTLGLAFSKTCPYAPIKSLAVGETTCDAKKKVWDILAQKVNFHIMEVPQKKNVIDAHLWDNEVHLFVEKLENLAEKKLDFTKLKETTEIMNKKRKALQRLAELRKKGPISISGLDALVVMQAALNDEPVRFTKKVEELCDELEDRIKKGISPFSDKAKRIMVSGCPSVMGNWKIHSLIESSGGAVVVDETCTGVKYFKDLVDTNKNDLDGLLSAIADRYLKLNCSCFTPNNDRLEMAKNLAIEGQVKGVVQYVLQYCHTYNIEAIRVEGTLKQANIPSIKIVTDYSEEDTAQIRTRIEAFLETLA